MSGSRDRVLSAREAARIIYNAANPTDEQTNKVRAKIARGLLPGAKGHWTTTSGGVADYLAAKVGAPAARRKSAGHAARRPADQKRLSTFYRDLLKDYFLAMALRRRSGRTKTFDRAVLAGQIGTLVLGIAVLVAGYRAGLGLRVSAEQVAVVAWLDANVESYKIIEWFPPLPHDDGVLVRVRYKYFENRKPIDTDRRFLVRPGRPAEWYLVEE